MAPFPQEGAASTNEPSKLSPAEASAWLRARVRAAASEACQAKDPAPEDVGVLSTRMRIPQPERQSPPTDAGSSGEAGGIGRQVRVPNAQRPPPPLPAAPKPRQTVDALLAELKSAQDLVNKQQAGVEERMSAVRIESVDLEEKWRDFADERKNLLQAMDSARERRSRVQVPFRSADGSIRPFAEIASDMRASDASTIDGGSTMISYVDTGTSIDIEPSDLQDLEDELAGPRSPSRVWMK